MMLKKTFFKRSMMAIAAASICGCLSVASVYAKDSDYIKGQQQLDQQDWSRAESTFQQIIKQQGDKQDAALYWLAYAQSKSGQQQKALESLNKLNKGFPKSSWIDDSAALRAEIDDQLGLADGISSDEMKLYAIDSLLSSSSTRSTEILSKIIKSNSSDKIKKRAIFVLSQSSQPDAFKLISELAKDSSNEVLQLVAIETLGMAGSKKSISLLKSIYSNTQSNEVKHQVLQSYMMANDKATLLELAMTEKNLDLQKQSIQLIGMMNGTNELMELYKNSRFKSLRMQIIEAIAIGGGADQLMHIIATEKEPSLVVEAVEKMGIIHGSRTEQKLFSLYQKNTDTKIRFAVIEAMFMQGNAKGLISIVKSEKNVELKREALSKLSMIDSDEVIEFFSQSFN